MEIVYRSNVITNLWQRALVPSRPVAVRCGGRHSTCDVASEIVVFLSLFIYILTVRYQSIKLNDLNQLESSPDCPDSLAQTTRRRGYVH